LAALLFYLIDHPKNFSAAGKEFQSMMCAWPVGRTSPTHMQGRTEFEKDLLLK
jgi:hypothetical protein